MPTLPTTPLIDLLDQLTQYLASIGRPKTRVGWVSPIAQQSKNYVAVLSEWVDGEADSKETTTSSASAPTNSARGSRKPSQPPAKQPKWWEHWASRIQAAPTIEAVLRESGQSSSGSIGSVVAAGAVVFAHQLVVDELLSLCEDGTLPKAVVCTGTIQVDR